MSLIRLRHDMRTLLCLLAAVLAAPHARGNSTPGELYELLDGEDQPFERLEASGVTYFRGRLAVVDDTINALFLFDLRGRLVRRIDSPRFPHEQAKFEDIAYRSRDGSFLAVGSHSGWDDETLDRQSVLLEFRLRDLDEIDERSVEKLPLYRAFERLGLWRPRGMKIEGLAIDDAADALYVGLREPVDRARIYRLAGERAQLTGSRPEADVALEFDAGAAEGTPYCVSALVWDAARDGLWIATSTENDETHQFLGNRLWFWPAGGSTPEPELVLDRFDAGLKAEGLALGAERLFIVYDNDQDDTAIPSQLRVVPLDVLRSRLLTTE
jgi:hypothetical protein